MEVLKKRVEEAEKCWRRKCKVQHRMGNNTPGGRRRRAGEPLTQQSQTHHAPRAARRHPRGSCGGKECSELWRPRVSPRRPQILRQPLRHRIDINIQSAYEATRKLPTEK